MGGAQSVPYMEYLTFEPPIPYYYPSGRDNKALWADIQSQIGGDAYRRFRANQQKYIGKTVHWCGCMLGVDGYQNALLFKMNPSYTNDPKRPDVILRFPQSISAGAFQAFSSKHFDFTGKVYSNMNGQAILVFENYDIYDRDYIDGAVKQILQNGAQSAEYLNQNIYQSPNWVYFVMDTYPITIKKMFVPVTYLNSVVTFELVKISGKQVLGKTNPPGSSLFMQPNPTNPPHDVVIYLAYNAVVPPTAKPGSLCSAFGKYINMDNDFVPVMQCIQLMHHNKPDAKLSTVPTNGGRVTWDYKSIEQLNKYKNYAIYVSYYLASLRGASRAPSMSASTPPHVNQSPQSSSIKPTIGVPVIRPTINRPASINAVEEPADSAAASQSYQETTEQDSLHQSGEATDQKQNLEAQPVEPQPESEVAQDDNPNVPRPVCDENGRVVLEEERNEFAGKDVADVALTLMREAPKTSYTQNITLDYMGEEEDDAVRRVRAMKENGFLNEFENKADDYLNQLNQFVANSKQGEIGVGNAYNDYGNYGSGYENYGGDYGNNYGNYNNYGTDNYGTSNYGSQNGGYNDNYGSYGSTNYDSNNYGSYGGNSYDNNNYGGSNYGNYGGDYSSNYGGGW